MQAETLIFSWGDKVFRILSFLLDKTTLHIALLIYFRAPLDTGFGLFSAQIGRFIEGRWTGIRVQLLWWEWHWYRKRR